MRRLLLALAVLVAMAAAPGGSFAQERGSVTGQVIASDTEQPPGVRIVVASPERPKGSRRGRTKGGEEVRRRWRSTARHTGGSSGQRWYSG